MDIRTTVKDIVESKGGIAKSADFVAAGIRAVDIVNLCNSGYLTRVRHGYYQMAEQSATTEEQMLATLIPQGIVCVESALYHYGYSDFAPRKWSIAVPRTVSRAKLDVEALPLQTYYVQQDLYGNLICIDIHMPDKAMELFPQDCFFLLDHSGQVAGKSETTDFYLYAYSRKVARKVSSVYIGCSLADIYRVAELYIDKLYALDKYLIAQKSR